MAELVEGYDDIKHLKPRRYAVIVPASYADPNSSEDIRDLVVFSPDKGQWCNDTHTSTIDEDNYDDEAQVVVSIYWTVKDADASVIAVLPTITKREREELVQTITEEIRDTAKRAKAELEQLEDVCEDPDAVEKINQEDE